MSQIAGAPRFSIGSVFATTLREMRRRLWTYLGLFILFTIPSLLLNVVATPSQPASDAANWAFLALAVTVSIVMTAGLTGAFVYSVTSNMSGRKVGFAVALGEGIRRIPLGSVIVFAMLVLFLALAAVFSAIVYGAHLATQPEGVFFVVRYPLLALVLAIALALVVFMPVYTRVFVAVPVAMAENAGPVAAFSRSLYLTKGARWAIFLLVMIMLVVIFLLFISFNALLRALIAEIILASIADGGASDETTMAKVVGVLVMTLAIWAPIITYSYLVPIVAYFLLSVEKDGRLSVDASDVFT